MRLIFVLCLGVLTGLPSLALADVCKSLWVERNAIFDARGYCFGSALGKAVFNNADCHTKNPSLSSSEKRRVASIKAREKSLNCAAKKKHWRAASMPRPGSSVASARPSPQGGSNCRDLWVKRNIIYDRKGYCFKTALAKGVFDNSDCYTLSPKLTASEKAAIADTQRREKAMNCAAQKPGWTVSSFGGSVTQSRPRRNTNTANLAPWQKALVWYVETSNYLNTQGGSRSYQCAVHCSKVKNKVPFTVYAHGNGDAYEKGSYQIYDVCRPFGGPAFFEFLECN